MLFADEPAGALNSSMTDDVMDAISFFHDDGTTITMVTHHTVVALAQIVSFACGMGISSTRSVFPLSTNRRLGQKRRAAELA